MGFFFLYSEQFHFNDHVLCMVLFHGHWQASGGDVGGQVQSVSHQGSTIRLRLHVPETKEKEMVVGQSISTERTVQ